MGGGGGGGGEGRGEGGGVLWKRKEKESCRRQAYRREWKESEGTRREISRLPEVSGTAPVSPV